MTKGKPRGRRPTYRVLTEEQVRRIVELYKAGFGESARIARELGLKRSTVEAVITGKTWTKVTGGALREYAAPKWEEPA